MDPSTAAIYLVGATCLGGAVHLLPAPGHPLRRSAPVAGAFAVVIAGTLLGMLGGQAGLFVWMTVVCCLRAWHPSRGTANSDDEIGGGTPAWPAGATAPPGEPLVPERCRAWHGPPQSAARPTAAR